MRSLKLDRTQTGFSKERERRQTGMGNALVGGGEKVVLLGQGWVKDIKKVYDVPMYFCVRSDIFDLLLIVRICRLQMSILQKIIDEHLLKIRSRRIC